MTTRSPHAAAAPALVAVLTVLTLELVRSSGPLLDMAFSRGVAAAAGTALVTYALPGAVAGLLLLRRRGRPSAPTLLPGVLLLAVLRLVVQGLVAGPRFAVGLLTVAVAVAVLTLAVSALARRPDGGRTAAGAIVAGAAGGVGLQLALGTWDAYWQHTVTGWVVTVALAVGLVLVGWSARPTASTIKSGSDGTRGLGVRRLWLLGPALALSVMMLANPAFAASQSGVPLAVAGPVTALGLLLAALGGVRWAATSRGLWAALVLTVAVAAIHVATGPLVLLALVTAQVALVACLSRALEPTPSRSRSRDLTAATASLVGLGTILPLLVHQLDYDLPLGFPNELVLVATAAVLGLGSVRSPDGPAPSVRRRSPVPAPLLIGAAALAVLGTAVTGVATAQTVTASRAPDQGTGELDEDVVVVSWNLHYGVSPAGDVGLEEVARTLEAQGACVVLLQEVSRGWVMGGGVDVATWLSNRLGLRMSFAPAADRQFGNAILSCRPQHDVVVHALPYGQGPQNRSAVSATVEHSTPLRYTSVHLQHRESSTPTRLDQLEVLLAAGDLGLLGGDLNAEPGWPEIDLLTAAGYVSLQDELGDPSALTSPSTAPAHRIDWMFVRPSDAEVMLDFAVLEEALSSDHLPLTVTRCLADDAQSARWCSTRATSATDPDSDG